MNTNNDLCPFNRALCRLCLSGNPSCTSATAQFCLKYRELTDNFCPCISLNLCQVPSRACTSANSKTCSLYLAISERHCMANKSQCVLPFGRQKLIKLGVPCSTNGKCLLSETLGTVNVLTGQKDQEAAAHQLACQIYQEGMPSALRQQA